jgi:hypothetical protein
MKEICHDQRYKISNMCKISIKVDPKSVAELDKIPEAGHQLRQPSAASATSYCCYHYRCGGVYDFFGSGSSCSAALVRVSTSSSFYGRSWIRD